MPKTKRLINGLLIALLTAFFTLLNPPSLFAERSEILIKKIEFIQQNQLTITLASKASFKVFTLENPNRLVVDITHAKLENQELKPSLPSFIIGFRSKENKNFLRLVFDLRKKIAINKIHFEKTANNFGKIIASLTLPTEMQPAPRDFISGKIAEFDIETKKISNSDGSSKYLVRKIPKKIPVIVIDAGHGGKDPGTIGNFARSKEKNVTLSYAKELHKQLINSGNYRAYLTRDSDHFIPLRQRVEKARKLKADLFISLHANSIADDEVSGFSIYTLSEKSSDRQAELLAQKENRADVIAGLDFADTSADIVKTLIDLSQRQSNNSSARFANLVIQSIKDSQIKILQNSHRFAGFVVLTAPDMASTLIELGYLSNKEEEKWLNSLSYRRKVVNTLVNAIDTYFSKNK